MPGIICPCEYLIDSIDKIIMVETESGRIYTGRLVSVNGTAVELKKYDDKTIICCDKINAVTIKDAYIE